MFLLFVNHHVRVPFVSQSGEGKANKVHNCFSKRLVLSTKGKNKTREMKGRRWGEMCAALFERRRTHG